ncbi:hypothetical protein VKT23_005792 [Stygiomarasmius scandens]|uniref:Uncharacterized protein n=1 Tax=Marasmiellus scandens TaxID=2682957 RepID=A0ABR1JRY9_9AGAR
MSVCSSSSSCSNSAPKSDEELLREYKAQWAKIHAVGDSGVAPMARSFSEILDRREKREAKAQEVRKERERLLQALQQWKADNKDFVDRHFKWTKEMEENHDC